MERTEAALLSASVFSMALHTGYLLISICQLKMENSCAIIKRFGENKHCRAFRDSVCNKKEREQGSDESISHSGRRHCF